MLKPIKDRLLVLRDDHEKETASGIILPKEEMPTGTGIIMAIGPEVKTLEVGQKVLFKKLDGHDFKLDGKEHVILKEFNILGVM